MKPVFVGVVMPCIDFCKDANREPGWDENSLLPTPGAFDILIHQ